MTGSVGSTARRLRILTWHVHGNYLYALSQVPHDFVIPVASGRRPGYTPLGGKIPWGRNISEVRVEDLAQERFDCLIYQSRATYEDDAPGLLTASQRALPSIYLEHDPPLENPTETLHWFRQERGLLVHVTHYNALAWDSAVPVEVIEHGVPANPSVHATGELARGITVINHLKSRGRRMGGDLFQWTRERVPLDLIGMQSEEMGGLGEISNMQVGATIARYRFFYTPIRYTSLGLALIEAMLAGVPVVGIAATELPTVIANGQNGFVHNDNKLLVDVMQHLIARPDVARRWGDAGRTTATTRFGMARFVRDWKRAIDDVMAMG